LRQFKLTLVLLLLITISAAYATNQFISVQGQLKDSADDYIDTPTNLTFSIYSAPTGGTSLFSQTKELEFGPNGVFSADIGPITSSAVDFTTQKYLQIGVENSTGAVVNLTPRTNLTRSPFAYVAADVDAESNINMNNFNITGVTNFISNIINATTTIFNGVSYTWPGSDGSSGQTLTTSGSGTLSWSNR